MWLNLTYTWNTKKSQKMEQWNCEALKTVAYYINAFSVSVRIYKKKMKT